MLRLNDHKLTKSNKAQIERAAQQTDSSEVFACFNMLQVTGNGFTILRITTSVIGLDKLFDMFAWLVVN